MRAWNRAAPWGAGIVSLGAYLWTLAPSVGFIDAGELAAVAHTFGVAHPTGYPTFTLLAGAWSHLVPFGDVIFRLNVLAALWTALAVVVVARTARVLLERAGVPSPAGSVAAALSFGLSRTVWGNALGIEVYALHVLLLALLLQVVVVRCLAQEAPARAPARALGLAVGLALTNHLTTVQLLPALGVGLLLAYGARGAIELLARATPWVAVGLIPYAWLPLRAATDPVLNWGDPDTLSRFLDHVGGAAYRSRLFMSPGVVLDYASHFATTLPDRLAWAPALLAGLGAFAAWRRDRTTTILLATAFATCAVVASGYAIVDIESYYLLADLVVAVWVGFGVAWLGARSLPRSLGLAAAVALCLLVVNGPRVSERGNYVVEDYTKDMLDSLEPRALVFSAQWDQWVSAFSYFRLVEDLRPDVLLIDPRPLQNPWYLAQLRSRHPEVFAGATDAADALERALGSRDEDVARALYGLLRRLADVNLNRRPVYITAEIEEAAFPHLQQVPEGLALRLYPPTATPRAEVWDDFRFREPPRRNRRTDQIETQYATMLLGRGVFFERRGALELARRYYARAGGYRASPMIRAQIDARLSGLVP